MFSGWTYIFHRGRTDGYGNEHQLFFNRARGFDVEGEQAVPSVRASNNPAPAVFDDDLYVFYQDENELGDLCVAILHKGKWRHECISSRVMSKSPTAVVAPDNQGNDRLIVFYQGYRKNGSLCSTTFDGTTRSEYRKPSENYLTGSPSAVYR